MDSRTLDGRPLVPALEPRANYIFAVILKNKYHWLGVREIAELLQVFVTPMEISHKEYSAPDAMGDQNDYIG